MSSHNRETKQERIAHMVIFTVAVLVCFLGIAMKLNLI